MLIVHVSSLFKYLALAGSGLALPSITPLSASKIKKASPKLTDFTYTNIGQNK
jgi:hypothetical protein